MSEEGERLRDKIREAHQRAAAVESTTLARRLAEELGIDVTDTDEVAHDEH